MRRFKKAFVMLMACVMSMAFAVTAHAEEDVYKRQGYRRESSLAGAIMKSTGLYSFCLLYTSRCV